MSLKILSYNIHSCIGADGRYSPQRIRDVILSSGADLVALQEVDTSLEVEDGVDQLGYLASETGMQAVIGPTMKRSYGSYGNAFLSRLPLSEIRESDLTYRRFEPRGSLRIAVENEDRKIEIVNTHLGLKWWERRFQVARLLDSLEETKSPLILLGDFNEWLSWSASLRELKRNFDSFTDAKTFPSRWPKFKLDRIFVSPRPSNFEYGPLTDSLARVASDHLPLQALIEF